MKVKFLGESDPLELLNDKIYEVIEVDEESGWYRIVDETNDDYLFPPEDFEIVEDDAKRHLCPVCGKHEFDEVGSYDYCPICGWCDDLVQEKYPDDDNCSNEMSLNQAREAYAKGEQVR